VNCVLLVLLVYKVHPTPRPPPFSVACSQRLSSVVHRADQSDVCTRGLAKTYDVQALRLSISELPNVGFTGICSAPQPPAITLQRRMRLVLQ
jgi:hypothetical protein